MIDRCLFPLQQAIDVGGKCGYINPDEKTVEYVRSLPGGKSFELFRNDADVRYLRNRRYRCQQDRAAGRVSADRG